MTAIKTNKYDEVVMTLLHYFITEEGYNPIVLHGAKDEIWLENLHGEYKIVRIVTNYIHNDEQFKFDFHKTKHIMNKIRRKTLSFKLNALSIFLNIGDNVNIDDFTDDKNVKIANIEQIKDLKKYNFITDVFPKITNASNYKEKGLDLFMKLTGEINKKNETDASRAENIFKAKDPIVTKILIGINLIMFALMYINGNGSTDNITLINYGASFGPLIKAGEYYRLITSGFLHVGLLHLMFNMYALYIIGSQIESFYGKVRYLYIYFFSILIGNLLSLVFASNVIGVGASGAIFGLLGSLLYFGYHYRIYLGSVIRSQIIPLIFLNLMFGFLIPGIDNAAHIGGLIAGVLSSIVVGVKYKTTLFEQVNGLIMSAIFTVFLIYINFIM